MESTFLTYKIYCDEYDTSNYIEIKSKQINCSLYIDNYVINKTEGLLKYKHGSYLVDGDNRWSLTYNDCIKICFRVGGRDVDGNIIISLNKKQSNKFIEFLSEIKNYLEN